MFIGQGMCEKKGKCMEYTNRSRINLFGLANDINILGSAYNPFLSLSCEPTYRSYPYTDTVEDYKSWHDKGFNLFRIAMAWEHVQTSLGGNLNETNMQAVDKLVKAITDDGGQAILDIVRTVVGAFFQSVLTSNLAQLCSLVLCCYRPARSFFPQP